MSSDMLEVLDANIIIIPEGPLPGTVNAVSFLNKNSWMPTQVTYEEEEEEQEWETLFNTSHVREGLRRLAAEARRQFVAGETEEGGFAVE